MDPLLIVIVRRIAEGPYPFEARMAGVYAQFRGVGETAALAIADLFTSPAALEVRKWELTSVPEARG